MRLTATRLTTTGGKLARQPVRAAGASGRGLATPVPNRVFDPASG